MKKIIISLTVIFAIAISFGFILKKHQTKVVQLENVDVGPNQSSGELTVVNATNDEQW